MDTLLSFIPNYPQPEAKNVVEDVSSRYEFVQCRSIQTSTKKNMYFDHQIAFMRYMISIQDRILNIQETGTGKTYSLVCLAEEIKRKRTGIRKVYVLEKNDTVADDFANQVFQMYKDQYQPKKSNGTKIASISDWYCIVTHEKIASQLTKMSDEEIKKTYRGSVFFLDEAHNVYRNGENREENNNTYCQIKRLFDLVEKSIIVVSTATPARIEPRDINYIVGLINPDYMPDAKDDALSHEDIRKYMYGKVSYVRSQLSDDVSIINEGNKLNYQGIVDENGKEISISSDVKLYYSTMSDEQFQEYLKIDESDKFQAKHIVASAIAAPQDYELKSFEDYQKYACKIATILSIESQSKGCSYCFSESVREILHSLAIAFEKVLNYKKFTWMSDMNISTNIEKCNRYVMITGDNKKKEIENILRIFNDPRNVDGEYIKVILCSRVAREGISISHIRRGHLVTPNWSPATTHQALSRFIRITSHAELSKHGKLSVSVYRHAALAPGGNETYFIKDKKKVMQDIAVYKTVEERDIAIKRTMRVLKECSFDHYLHFERNVLQSDKDYTAVTDYSKKFEFDVNKFFNEENTVYDTYDILYADEEVHKICSRITDKLVSAPILLCDLLNNQIEEIEARPQIIKMAVAKLIAEKTQVTDKYGLTCYAAIDNYHLYLSRTYPNVSSPGYGYVHPSMAVVENNTVLNLAVDTQKFEILIENCCNKFGGDLKGAYDYLFSQSYASFDNYNSEDASFLSKYIYSLYYSKGYIVHCADIYKMNSYGLTNHRFDPKTTDLRMYNGSTWRTATNEVCADVVKQIADTMNSLNVEPGETFAISIRGRQYLAHNTSNGKRVVRQTTSYNDHPQGYNAVQYWVYCVNHGKIVYL
jgi:superfamily II DNA or RNA helicase